VTIRAGDNLKALLTRVNRAASERGKKSELAKFLGVPLSRVSNWLSMDRAPNGEVTLLMQQGVAAQGKNKHAPGRASNTAKGKTRSTNPIVYEKKRKPSPKRG
jgi:hypothetical protein